MTRWVWNCKATGLHINESELAFMKLVAANGRNKKVLSHAEATRRLGRSVGTARNSANSLKEKGLLLIRKRFVKDGGQTANEYVLTAEGVDLLRNLTADEDESDLQAGF